MDQKLQGSRSTFHETQQIRKGSYLKLLMEDFFPTFCSIPNSSNLLFQQDGAPPHWALHVRDWLNNNLADRWIGRGGPNDRNITWPPRSPDLTPLDFYLWDQEPSLCQKLRKFGASKKLYLCSVPGSETGNRVSEHQEPGEKTEIGGTEWRCSHRKIKCCW